MHGFGVDVVCEQSMCASLLYLGVNRLFGVQDSSLQSTETLRLFGLYKVQFRAKRIGSNGLFLKEDEHCQGVGRF